MLDEVDERDEIDMIILRDVDDDEDVEYVDIDEDDEVEVQIEDEYELMDDETEACRSDADVMLQIIEEDGDELDFV